MWCFFMCPIDVPDLSKLFFLFKKKMDSEATGQPTDVEPVNNSMVLVFVTIDETRRWVMQDTSRIPQSI